MRKFLAVLASITLAVISLSFAMAATEFAVRVVTGEDTLIGGPWESAFTVFAYAMIFGGVVAYVFALPIGLLVVTLLEPRFVYVLLLSLAGTFAAYFALTSNDTGSLVMGTPLVLGFATINAWLCWRLYLRIMRGHDAPNLTSPG